MCDTVFVTPKGRMVDYCRVINTRDQLILISSFFKAQHLIDWINRFVFLEDVEIQDVSDDYIWMTLLGPLAKIFLCGFTKRSIADIDESLWLNIEDIFFPALENTNFIIPAYNFCIEKKSGPSVISKLTEQLKSLNGSLIGDKAFQIIRVESGMPDYGTEITQDYNPYEARLTHAISFTKGCYTGQEVIARLDTYDKVQKYLMIIELNNKISNTPPLEIFIDDESVGHLTSYAYNPITKKSVGLGYIKKMYTLDNDIYVEIQTEKKRVSAKLKLPPQAYSENK
jgi:folate-binding protein YgfZ